MNNARRSRLILLGALALSTLAGAAMAQDDTMPMQGAKQQDSSNMPMQGMQQQDSSNMPMQGMKHMDQQRMGRMQNVMGRHQMPATVTSANASTGIVEVNSAGMSLTVHFPPASMKDLKAGDKITLHLAYSKP